MQKKKCPKGKIRNPKTGRCKTPCGRGRQVNPRTNRCVTKSYLRRIQNLSDTSDDLSDTSDDLSDTFSDIFDDFSDNEFEDSDFDPDDYGISGGHSLGLATGTRFDQPEMNIKPEEGVKLKPEPKENVSLEISRLKESLRLHERVSQDSKDLGSDSERVSRDLNAQADILDQIEDLEEYTSDRQLDVEFDEAYEALIAEMSESTSFVEDVLVAISTVPARILEELVDEDLKVIADEVLDEFPNGSWMVADELSALDINILGMIVEVSLDTTTTGVVHGLYKPGFHSTNCVSESHTTMPSLLNCGVYVVDPPFGRELVQRASEMNALLWKTSASILLHPIEFIESFYLSKHGFDLTRCILTPLGIWRITTFTADRSESEEYEDAKRVIEFMNLYSPEYDSITVDASSTPEVFLGFIQQLLEFIEEKISRLFEVEFKFYSGH